MRLTVLLSVLSTTMMLAFNAYSEDFTERKTLEWAANNQMCLQDYGWNSMGVTDKQCATMIKEIINQCISKLPEQFPQSLIEGNDSSFVKCTCKVYESYVTDIKKVPVCS